MIRCFGCEEVQAYNNYYCENCNIYYYNNASSNEYFLDFPINNIHYRANNYINNCNYTTVWKLSKNLAFNFICDYKSLDLKDFSKKEFEEMKEYIEKCEKLKVFA